MNEQNQHDIVEQLISDLSFVQWVQSEFTQNDAHWSEYIDLHPEEHDAINLAIASVCSTLLPNKLEDQKGDLVKSQPNDSILRHFLNYGYFWTIGLIMLVLTLFFFREKIGLVDKLVSVTAGNVNNKELVLPDGSSALMSPGTTIKYDPKTWSEIRSVTVDGLAYIKATKGEDMMIHVGDVNIKMIGGTALSVDSRFGNFELTCQKGHADVVTASHETASVSINENLQLIHDKLVKRKFPQGAVDMIPWMKGVYLFNGIPYRHVITELERQFDIQVEVDKAYLDKTYNGFFKKENINDALFEATWPLKLKYRLEGKKAYLTPDE